jgi:hypothetical protein
MTSHEQSLPDGTTIHYQRRGNGPPLVLLHTLRTQAEYFAFMELIGNAYASQSVLHW